MQKHEEWFKFAIEEVEAAKRLIIDDYPLILPGLYWCQQSMGKALKGYIYKHNKKVFKTHDLLILLEICSKFNQSLLKFEQLAEYLNPANISTRYPDSHIFFPDLTTATILYTETKKFVEYIINLD